MTISVAYEILFQDFGYPQTTSTEVLKSYVFNEPIVIDSTRVPPLGPASMFMVPFSNPLVIPCIWRIS